MGGFAVTRVRRVQRPPGRTARATPFKYMGGVRVCAVTISRQTTFCGQLLWVRCIEKKKSNWTEGGDVEREVRLK